MFKLVETLEVGFPAKRNDYFQVYINNPGAQDQK